MSCRMRLFWIFERLVARNYIISSHPAAAARDWGHQGVVTPELPDLVDSTVVNLRGAIKLPQPAQTTQPHVATREALCGERCPH